MKEIEQQLIPPIRTLATTDESLKNLRDNPLEAKRANEEIASELRRLIAEHKAEASAMDVRLALAEKEITDLKALLDRGRGFRSTLTITFISAIVSAICSATVAYMRAAEMTWTIRVSRARTRPCLAT